MEFDWDEHTLFHIAQHGITREDAEAALTLHPVRLEREIRNGERRTLFAGHDQAGRILAVVVTPRENRIRVVTAFPRTRGCGTTTHIDAEGSMKKIKTPLFANEREEADWWFANQDVIANAFEEEHGIPKHDFVAVDMQGEDARLIQQRAAAKGVEPHIYAEALLHAALHREEAA